MTTTDVPASQTLSRGIRVLEILADSQRPLALDDVAGELAVHRSIAYRLVRTLEFHGLVSRDTSGSISIGPGMAALAAGVAPDLQAEARRELDVAADELGTTCFLTVYSRDECVLLVSVEPRNATAALAQRPGTRHSVAKGAPGRAILSLIPESEWPADVPASVRSDVRGLGARGYAISHDEVIPTVQSVAVPLALRGRQPAALGVVYVGSIHSVEVIAARLLQAASAIRDALGG
ncbi:DNA-binding IclR family transcriptional regulator [Okibacterium sp. HSC-33S16]|uniref:IclR family transcriptional regulator n=1 Tax=Okibacterium sp. HSC-33S16 TaxID=2910965 RepID=UPI00209CD4F6|nr:helix-turn-helix domain-containing protein [Okibacterium sp. HSC-33S16]MCP2032487.1 DNA-binding IclR family transcriptional regulator [Okibacterium sp. HSC-33S16]